MAGKATAPVWKYWKKGAQKYANIPDPDRIRKHGIRGLNQYLKRLLKGIQRAEHRSGRHFFLRDQAWWSLF